MSSEQMELFSGTKLHRDADVVIFPIERQTGKVREVAQQLRRRRSNQAERYWKGECKRMTSGLLAAGVPMSDINAALVRFANAVQTEMDITEASERRTS